MKRKLATLLTLALTVTLFGGCGDSETEAQAQTTSNSSSGFFSEIISTHSDILSECLSKEKIIGYEVKAVDKEKKPTNIYFFEDGKVTIIPGSIFGLTMGDFAQMADEAIWKEYETVRETYKETYVNDTRADDLDRYLLEAYCEKEGRGYANINSYEELQLVPIILEAVRGKTYSELAGIEPIDVTGSNALNWSDSLAYTAEVCLTSYWNFQTLYVNDGVGDFVPLGDYTEEDRFWDDYGWKEDETVTFSGVFFEDAITHYKNAIATIEKMKADIGYNGPFFDLPFYFVIETDPSGNIVANERLVYPTLEDNLRNAPSTYYEYIKFANVDGVERQIYDTTYHCMGLGKGEAIFCTREYMALDTIDSKNVLIDLSKDDINELFKEEVTARYQ